VVELIIVVVCIGWVWWACQPESTASLRALHPDHHPSDTCAPPPIGCGKPIDGFSSPLTARVYRMEGLCEDCQRRKYLKEDQ
jgi:hypothetical protein